MAQQQPDFRRVSHDHRNLRGPFDLVGDVHGCYQELTELLERLGYARASGVFSHPEGRMLILLGDVIDEGPRPLDCLRLALSLHQSGRGLLVRGNHEDRFLRKLLGHPVKLIHGLRSTWHALESLPVDQRRALTREARQVLKTTLPYYILDDGRLIAAHAGLKEELQGKVSEEAREFALYGNTRHEARRDWTRHYDGDAQVVYGHVPHPEPVRRNNTLNIDTGCVHGNRLTAYRYPEDGFLSVTARDTYADPLRGATGG